MRDPLTCGARTHTGLVRPKNEDCFAILNQDGVLPTAFILADGMGGHRRGDLASRIAVDYVSERLKQELAVARPITELSRQLADTVEKANVKVYLGSLSHEQSLGMGTTLTLAVLLQDHILIAHVGDCRAWLLRGNELHQLTVDHTLVQEMVNSGSLTEAESHQHPRRNVLTRALGVPEYLQPDILTIPVQHGDRFLVSSDGMHNQVDAMTIRNAMKREKTPDDLVDTLVNLALEAGGDDNITVLAAYL